MLTIKIPKTELYDESTSSFIYIKEQTITLEHSLVSVHKWESKWCKPFLSSNDKTEEETLDYIRCMVITQNVDPMALRAIPPDQIKRINDYIVAPMTATTFSNSDNNKGKKEIITSELIYYWMIALNIPVEFQKWHLNQLMTLIRVCSIKNAPPKKMAKGEVINRNRALNAARRKRLGTHG